MSNYKIGPEYAVSTRIVPESWLNLNVAIWNQSTDHFVLQPGQLLLSILVGMANEEQQQIIEYLRTENQVLKEKIDKKRILLNDDQ